jgi:hypothetical protein
LPRSIKPHVFPFHLNKEPTNVGSLCLADSLADSPRLSGGREPSHVGVQAYASGRRPVSSASKTGVMGCRADAGGDNMDVVRRRQGFAAIGSLLGLVAGIAALTPGASAAPTVHSCGNRIVSVAVPGEPGAAPTTVKIRVKNISSQGVSCTAAYEFLGLLYNNHGTSTPEKYKCVIGHFKVPAGSVPEICTKRGAKLQFAGQGG